MYFIEVWKAAGVPTEKVQFLFSSDAVNSRDYWKKVVLVAKNTTISRATRCLTIMGRKEGEMKEVAQYFYPMMQVADIFHLDADIAQLGLDQRRANMLAREIGPKLGWWKPVVVSHHMLMGLEGGKSPEGYDENSAIDTQISSKMSKSKPETSIFVHDTLDEIKKKLSQAYCPPKQTENNPLMDYTKHIIFRAFGEMKIERKREHGGDIVFTDYNSLEKLYLSGALHPLDLKNAVALYLDILIAPVRNHFNRNPKARRMYEFVKRQQVTR
jgi:tyrosyl-tRNA synthetase